MAETTSPSPAPAISLAQRAAGKTARLGHVGQADKVRQTAEQFEAMFIAQMLTPMFEGISSEPPFGGGHAEDMYKSMMIDEMAKLTTKAGGIGIADHVMEQILKQQESP